MQSDTADRILDSAHALLAERGYAAFSFADIADMVKIRKPSIHHHFASKAILVTAVLKQHRDTLNEALNTLTHNVDSPLKRLGAYVLHWEKCIRDKTEPICIAALLGAELPTLPDEAKVEIKRYFRDLKEWVRKTLEDGSSQGIIQLQQTPAVEAETFIALMHGAMISARVYGSSKVYTAVMQDALSRLAAQP
ncbi:TetR/AcrR family transcriptional regulator [Tunturiibacter lichenicola]|uniref:TetR/AcrR family transcriptional regulator n=1 Tax=Tunturiibacter lichenicola TaxID=2051959 RepID=UPI0021B16D66|nr:TetR/AcrR family transcriptional regulator [Edaphobacter lichenicola]